MRPKSYRLLLLTGIAIAAAVIVLAGKFNHRVPRIKPVASAVIDHLACALEQYRQDTGRFPGEGAGEGESSFPALFDALYRKTDRSAPYLEIHRGDRFLVPGGAGGHRPARPEEIADPKIPKVLADPWGRPYVYRVNASRPPRAWMRNPDKYDLYSLGPDGIDGTLAGEPGDDIGNWDR